MTYIDRIRRRADVPALVERLKASGVDCAMEAARILSEVIPSNEDLFVDLNTRRAIRGNRSIDLTQNEVVLLYTLNEAHGDVVGVSSLHRAMYGAFVSKTHPRADNTVRVQMNRLRRRIREVLKVEIYNRHGQGYHLELLPLEVTA